MQNYSLYYITSPGEFFDTSRAQNPSELRTGIGLKFKQKNLLKDTKMFKFKSYQNYVFPVSQNKIQ